MTRTQNSCAPHRIITRSKKQFCSHKSWRTLTQSSDPHLHRQVYLSHTVSKCMSSSQWLHWYNQYLYDKYFHGYDRPVHSKRVHFTNTVTAYKVKRRHTWLNLWDKQHENVNTHVISWRNKQKHKYSVSAQEFVNTTAHWFSNGRKLGWNLMLQYTAECSRSTDVPSNP